MKRGSSMVEGDCMFTGKTENLGVIGWPIAHSLSPVLQNAALREAGLDYAYIALPVSPKDLPAAVEGLRAMNFRGFNVTIPHKTTVIPLLDEIDKDACIIGAVNTVINENGRLRGCNTDAGGFIGALEEKGFRAEGKHVAVLGAGGAARAVIWGLVKNKARRISIGVRNPSKAGVVMEFFQKYTDIAVFFWESEEFRSELEKTDLLVNTTPLGMYPAVDAMPSVDFGRLNKDAFVYDIIYTPYRTRFLKEAAALGHPVLNGEGMLAGQGAEAFRLWTGKKANVDLMKKTLREYLEELK